MIEYTKKLHKRLINIETISELIKNVSRIIFIFSPVILIIIAIGASMKLELLKSLDYLGIMTVYFIKDLFLYILSGLYRNLKT